MAFGYVVAQISVTNSETYPEYVAMVEPIVKRFGGEYLVRGGRAESHEGEPPGTRNVLIRFPSFAAAQNWYHSPDYAEAKALRRSASVGVLSIMEGL